MANFSTVSRVQQTIRAGDEVEWTRGSNRVKINNAANCAPPLDPETAKKLGIKINVNWGELMVLLSHARRQYMSAFWGQQHFFKVTLPRAPKETQSEWGAFITEEINDVMKNSLEYFELHRSRWAQVVCHGIGPMCWPHEDKWLGRCIAIEDLRIATDTTLDFANLGWYGIRHIYTPYELLEEAFNDKKHNPWDTKGVANILKNYKEINYDYAPNHYDWETTPEKLAELVKQDGGFYASDAMPGIPLWHFYFDDPTIKDNAGWFLKIVPEQGTVRGTPENDKFLWTSDTPVAPTWKQLVHCQYGDLSNKSPFTYPAVRSLGFALLEPTFYTNLSRNKMLQHMFDQFDVWLRISDPAEKARALFQEFGNFKALKSGVSVVGQNERHQVDADFVEMGMAQLKQLMQEASASYTQQTDTGTRKEQTAFETNVKLQQVNAMMGGLLQTAFIYATHEYREICRRFCLKKTNDEDILYFQKRWDEEKIPREWMNPRLWRIEPVTPLGMGNPAMAQAEAQQLMTWRGAYEPEAQNEILHEATQVVTGSWQKAKRWAPLGKDKVMPDGAAWAVAVFGTLMQGVPVPVRQGLSAIEQVDQLLPLLAGVIVKYEKRDNTATADEAAGMGEVGQYIGQLLQQLSTDEQQKQYVKQKSDDLGKLMNQVKALAQRGAEAKAKQNGGMNSEQSKAMAPMIMAHVKGKIAEGKAAQTQRHKEKAFTAEQRRKDAATFGEIQRQGVKASRMKASEE